MKIHFFGSSCAELLDMVKGTRSRRAANAMALEKLGVQSLGDSDVLAVLDAWSFYTNKKRVNVIPEGSTAVESDTLGLVRTRTGQVLATGMTKR